MPRVVSSPAMAPVVSDEGIPYRWHGAPPQEIVNMVPPEGLKIDRRRMFLHVKGRTFLHVREDAEGRWVYRRDQ